MLASSAAVRGPFDFSNTSSSLRRPSGLPGSSSVDVIVAAELEPLDGVELALRQVGREPELAGGEHIGRRRDDGGARIDRALRGLDLDADAAGPVDPRRRRRQPHRQLGREPARPGAEPLPAEGLHVALGGAREIGGRDFRQVLAAEDTGPSMNSTVERHSPRSFGSACAQAMSALRAASAIAGWRAPCAASMSSISLSRA